MTTNQTNKKAEGLVNAISAPYSLSEQQVNLAKKIVKEKLLEGFTVQNFCKENGISTKTYYEWFEDADFNYYVNEISGAVIPSDEKEAFQRLKKIILKIADKPNPSIKEIELFTDTFSYVVENDKRERMEALGISDSVKPATAVNVEERKASLLARLIAPVGDNIKKPKGDVE